MSIPACAFETENETAEIALQLQMIHACWLSSTRNVADCRLKSNH